MPEIIPIVDFRDHIIDSVDKQNFDKTTGQIYRTVSLFLFDLKGNVLIQRRAYNKQTFAGKWDLASVAGHVMFGEDYLESIVRETQEELGINIPSHFFRTADKIFTETHDGKRRFTQIFWAKFDFSIDDLKISQREIAEVKLISFADLREYLPQHRDEFSHYNNFDIFSLEDEIKK